MPVDINTQSGLSNAFTSVGGTQRFTSGYPIGTAPAGIIATKIRGQTLTEDHFPSDLPKFHFCIVQNEWRPQIGGSTLTPERLIKLQLPTPLVDAQEINYEQNFNYLGSLGRFLENQIGRGVQAVTGLTLNTFKTVTMSAPDYRTFQLSWKFSPKTYQESVTIQKIIYALKRAAAPKKTAEGNTGKLLLRFPKIFSLYFFPNVQFMFKFKPCVLTTISVDYAGGNPFPAFYRQEGDSMANSPVESVTLNTNWLELEYWLDHETDTDFKTQENGIPTNDAFDAWNYYTYDSNGQTFQQPKAKTLKPGDKMPTAPGKDSGEPPGPTFGLSPEDGP